LPAPASRFLLTSHAPRLFASSAQQKENSRTDQGSNEPALEHYPHSTSSFIPVMQWDDGSSRVFPTYRVLDENGRVVKGAQDPDLDKDTVVRIYRLMVILGVMDRILKQVQRQGRISFYMTNSGEEATHFGSAAALTPEDNIFAQYREAGVFMWRGWGLEDYINQCYSNHLDLGKGRQMPVHYGSKALNYQTISSPLATQIPQAAGSAYAQKLSGTKACTMCYFGDGAASEGDFHASLNFAATIGTPTIFFCRNNGYAISTPVSEQLKGDGIAARGPAYGIRTIRVDGNDVFAVYDATKEARRYAVDEGKPVLIEAMTYRLGDHSTSDDSSRYRTPGELDLWRDKLSPQRRLRLYLERKGWWNEEENRQLVQNTERDVLEGLKKAENQLKPPIDDLFTDVYSDVPKHLQEQKDELYKHLSLYPDAYPISMHKPNN